MPTNTTISPRPTPPGVEQFSLTNLAVVGVWIDLSEEGMHRAARAWLRAHSLFGFPDDGRPHSASLIVTPASRRDERVLRSAWERIEASLARRIGYSPSRWRTTLALDLRPASEHPGPDRHDELSRHVSEALGARLGREIDAVAGADFAARLADCQIGTAGSESCGRYDVLIVPDATDDDLAAIKALMQPASDLIHAYGKHLRRSGAGTPTGVTFNNLTPVVTDRGAPREKAGEGAGASIQIGVLMPGGTAAPRDMLGKLEQLEPDVEVIAQTVPRSTPALTAAMIRAVDTLLDQHPAALVAGYGGGDRADLDHVTRALKEALSRLRLPMYVGIGHRDWTAGIDSEHVRMCATPSDAAELCRIETVEIPQSRALLAAQAASELAAAVGDPDRSLAAVERFTDGMSGLDKRLKTARSTHLQPPR